MSSTITIHIFCTINSNDPFLFEHASFMIHVVFPISFDAAIAFLGIAISQLTLEDVQINAKIRANLTLCALFDRWSNNFKKKSTPN